MNFSYQYNDYPLAPNTTQGIYILQADFQYPISFISVYTRQALPHAMHLWFRNLVSKPREKSGRQPELFLDLLCAQAFLVSERDDLEYGRSVCPSTAIAVKGQRLAGLLIIEDLTTGECVKGIRTLRASRR